MTAICCCETRLYLRVRRWPRRDIRSATKPPIRWIISAILRLKPEQLPCRCRVWLLPSITLHAAEAQFADAYSRRRGLAADRQDAGGARRPQGTGRTAMPQNTGWSIAAICSARPASCLLGPEANELVLFDQAKQFSSTHRLGTDSRPAVSARADAARFRGASPAPPRAVGRVQVRADEILSRRARHRHRRARRAVEGSSRDRCCSIRR